jgi:hypothetical protein
MHTTVATRQGTGRDRLVAAWHASGVLVVSRELDVAGAAGPGASMRSYAGRRALARWWSLSTYGEFPAPRLAQLQTVVTPATEGHFVISLVL